MPQPLELSRRCVGAQHDQHRVARREVNEGKREQCDAEQDDERMQEALEDVGPHEVTGCALRATRLSLLPTNAQRATRYAQPHADSETDLKDSQLATGLTM